MAVAAADSQYRAATEGVAVLDRSQAGKLAVDGPDAIAFLDSLLSNDIAAIAVGAGAEATLLTHKGRMLAAARVLRTADELLLDTERVALQALFENLHRFRLGYRAQVHKRTVERSLLSLIGPHADAMLADPPGEREHDHRRTTLAGHPLLAIRTLLGVDLLFESEHLDAVGAHLTTAGAVEIDEGAAETVRIEHGRPRYGVEIDETTMPQEAGLHERAVSYSKGCYVGQETVARLYWKGKPNRELRGLTLSGPAAPGAQLRLGDQAVGTLGSAVVSPRLGPIGLALVRREAPPGCLLAVGDDGVEATVAELPFAS
jgi:tRNA-modifying protein YgfZ